MTKVMVTIIVVLSLAIPTSAQEFTPPSVPGLGQDRMPTNTESFGAGLAELLQKSFELFYPALEASVQANIGILSAGIIISLFSIVYERMHSLLSMVGAIILSSILFQDTKAMIAYASETVLEICEYGKLLCPVMTTALAAQGGIATSAAFYTGTTVFIAILSSIVSKCFVPMVYLYVSFSVANCALNEAILNNIAGTIKKVLIWLLKSLLIVFTTYISITGIISGTTDAAALKTAKVMISSVVPVVGSILSDASESVLISMGMIKNTAGIYGIFAILAVFMGPFLEVGAQYLLLKASGVIYGLFGDKKISALIEDFSSAMGLLVAMVATACILMLISSVCYLKGIG